MRAVVADGGGGDEHARARVGRLDPGHEVARAELARGADAALGVVAPALRDVLAREVDDGVAAGERRGGRRLVLGLPRDGAGGGRVARQRDDVVAAGAQALDELVPIRPLAPVTVTFMRGVRRGGCLCSPRDHRPARSARSRPSSGPWMSHANHHDSEPHEGLRRRAGRRRSQLRHRRGQGRRLPRAQRVGQDDDAALARRPRHADLRDRDDQRRPATRSCATR